MCNGYFIGVFFLHCSTFKPHPIRPAVRLDPFLGFSLWPQQQHPRVPVQALSSRSHLLPSTLASVSISQLQKWRALLTPPLGTDFQFYLRLTPPKSFTKEVFPKVASKGVGERAGKDRSPTRVWPGWSQGGRLQTDPAGTLHQSCPSLPDGKGVQMRDGQATGVGGPHSPLLPATYLGKAVFPLLSH